MAALRKATSGTTGVLFHGTYEMDADTMVNNRERVQMTAHKVWKATRYYFQCYVEVYNGVLEVALGDL